VYFDDVTAATLKLDWHGDLSYQQIPPRYQVYLLTSHYPIVLHRVFGNPIATSFMIDLRKFCPVPYSTLHS